MISEPPPLDYEIPPPLDDKVRDDDNDFDLDDEIAIEDNISSSLDLPELELPSDYNVFASAATDDRDFDIPLPPELNVPSPEPPSKSKVVESEKEVSSHCDVAEKKESEKVYDESVPCCAAVASEFIRQETDEHVIGERPEPEGSCELDDIAAVVTCDGDKSDENRSRCEDEKPTEMSVNTIGDEPFELNDEQKTENKDIPEQINANVHVPELKTLDDDDDDFDDFNEFESAIPVNRHVELVQQIDSKLSLSDETVTFEADFSGFNAFGDSKDDFDDFQDFTSAVESATSQLNAADDDDDYFGDFSDFKEAPVLPEPSTFNSRILMKPTNVNETIDMMFPSSESSKSISDETSAAVEPKILKSDKFVNKFDDFDATVALGYQYTSSKASQILVKSLGIDTRNIVSLSLFCYACTDHPH